ncbi:MAG: hypothetical protein WDN47_00555 [Candidatus Doudnabacteria bacterium]
MSISVNNGDWPKARMLKIIIGESMSEQEIGLLTFGLRPGFIQKLNIVVFDLTHLERFERDTCEFMIQTKSVFANMHKPLVFVANSQAVQEDLKKKVKALPKEIFAEYGAAINCVKQLVDPVPLKPSPR